MNWKRGLVRVWVVTSVLWIITAAWVLDPVESVREILAPVVVHTWDDVVLQFPLGTDAATVRNALISADRAEREENERRCATGGAVNGGAVNGCDPLCKYQQLPPEVDTYQPADLASLRWGMARIAGIIALPPIGVLLIALIIGWIIRGFRNEPPKIRS